MAGNSIGELFRITTWGESHGPAVGAVVDGCPPGIELTRELIQKDLDRRRPGQGPFASKRRERDKVEILSGVFGNRTTGTPIAMIIENVDVDETAYDDLKDIFRPGHADYTYWAKYGLRDHRGGGRASGRETAARVAAGAVARCILRDFGIEVFAFTRAIGGIVAEVGEIHPPIGGLLFCPDRQAEEKMLRLIEELKKEGDSIGGIVEVIARGCPAGLGEPVFDKLDADLAKAVMSIGAVKGVEIGEGFRAARLRGSENNDPITEEGFASNHAGGILGGISTGQEIVLRAAVKPIPSISREQETIDIEGRGRKITIKGRHDVCAVPRVVPVCEAMVCIVLADHLLRFRGQCGRVHRP